MSFREIFYENVVLKASDIALKQDIYKYLKFYKESQWWSRDKLIDYQNNKLRKLIQVVMNEVSFYRDMYSKCGITVDDISLREDLTKLPIATKEQLKVNYPQNCTRKSGWPEKEYFTSGSSGSPFAALIDNKTMSEARALMILRALYTGWELGEPCFQTGMTVQRGIEKKIKDKVFSIYYASAFDLRNDILDKFLEVIDNKNIRYLMGYPGSILALAERANRTGFNRPMSGLATWGDNLYEHYRKTIETQFNCRITDTYGCGEGIQVAAQCPDGYGHYHIFMPHVIVEVVDDDGQPVKKGEMGHLLLTRLEPGAMPLIRYRVGDLGRMSTEDFCKCGRGFENLEKIEGRDTDFVYTPSGNKLIVHFFTGIFEYYPEIKQFRVVQNEIDKIEIMIIPQNIIKSTVLSKIKNEIFEKAGDKFEIAFKIVDHIDDKVNGKRRFVISSLKHGLK